MAFTVDPERFRVPPELRSGVAGKRVLITGAGRDGGLGQAFALAAGLNGAAAVGVHSLTGHEAHRLRRHRSRHFAVNSASASARSINPPG